MYVFDEFVHNFFRLYFFFTFSLLLQLNLIVFKYWIWGHHSHQPQILCIFHNTYNDLRTKVYKSPTVAYQSVVCAVLSVCC